MKRFRHIPYVAEELRSKVPPGVLRGTLPTPPGLPPTPEKSVNPFNAALASLRTIFGLRDDQLPQALELPNVKPTVDVYHRPLYRVVRQTVASVQANPWRFRVPGTVVWEVISAAWALTTSGAVGTRQVSISIGESPSITYQAGSNFGQVASTTVQYVAAPSGILGDTTSGTPDLALIPLPIPCWLLPGQSIGADIVGFLAGDTNTSVTMAVREYQAITLLADLVFQPPA